MPSIIRLFELYRFSIPEAKILRANCDIGFSAQVKGMLASFYLDAMRGGRKFRMASIDRD